jgi:hypothetical protein
MAGHAFAAQSEQDFHLCVGALDPSISIAGLCSDGGAIRTYSSSRLRGIDRRPKALTIVGPKSLRATAR